MRAHSDIMSSNGVGGHAEDVASPDDEELLEGFCAISSINKAWCKMAPAREFLPACNTQMLTLWD